MTRDITVSPDTVRAFSDAIAGILSSMGVKHVYKSSDFKAIRMEKAEGRRQKAKRGIKTRDKNRRLIARMSHSLNAISNADSQLPSPKRQHELHRLDLRKHARPLSHPRRTISANDSASSRAATRTTARGSRTYRSRSRSSAGRVLHLVQRVVRPASRGCRRETGCRDGAASARPRPRCARANRTA
jgi:hypothetical protein